ncbi:hypothetical protein J3459_014225 [Metarhizium acridum]|uniref:Uncharacterized protein n=1 Tax=Metarhizium acridum (strain CQMa 102) TaxID=655827 RepID=E9E8Y7_METAQ|nr:uncharacterized protein MAC_06335 [Metarhizium acridum CQMa 102]EFY87623.1 hypothetical protein MAC_06335 [Metarhizium acridum CQMa 102]KAG8414605.1 hypothetical protein J3459_014225 [Metarhizium acridum]KAG8416251.1 hypothetical protein J3458_006847 [Metarhizium acridum]
MDVHGPPIRYPTPRQASTCGAENKDNGSSFRASDDSTLAESIPSSPRQPPAYGAERAPPLYQEEDDPDHVKARRKVRRTLCIRLLTSIFITVLVSLIVAAVVARIHDSNINPDWSSNETASNKTNGTSFTMISGNRPSSAPLLSSATEAAPQDAKTTVATRQAEATTASTSSWAPTSTADERAGQTVDCASMGVFVNATPVTDIAPVPTRITPTSQRRKVHLVVDDGDGDQVLGVSVYRFNGCLLSRESYRDSDGGLAYRCSLACPHKRRQTKQAREVVAEEWGACG